MIDSLFPYGNIGKKRVEYNYFLTDHLSPLFVTCAVYPKEKVVLLCVDRHLRYLNIYAVYAICYLSYLSLNPKLEV